MTHPHVAPEPDGAGGPRRWSTPRTAALRRELAAKAVATDELRVALDELRQVLDVETLPPAGRRPGRRRLLVVLGVLAAAIVGIAAVLLGGRDGGSIVRATPTSAPATGAAPAAVPRPAVPAPSPVAWPGGPVLLPPGLVATGPGASVPGTDVQVALDADGTHVDVVERLLLDAPAGGPLVLATPPPPALGRPRIVDLQVQLDDRVTGVTGADGPHPTAADPGRRYLSATLRYRIAGGVVTVAPAAPGRAFALVTPLTAAASQGAGRPVVVRTLDPHVVGVSCPQVPGAGAVCGSRAAGGWSASVPAGAGAVVLLQVDR